VAVRERYMGNHEERKAGMLGIMGLWKDRDDLEETDVMIRRLRDDGWRKQLRSR